MPLIQVTLWHGRDAATRERLMQSLTQATADTLDIPTEHVRVVLYEVDRSNWGVGGVPASKKDWGY